jgi:hypothetical protein
MSDKVLVPVEHTLKTDPDVYDDVVAGRKTFEIRFNDRDYQVGHRLRLQKTKYSGKEMIAGMPLVFTSDETVVDVLYILHGPLYGLADGWVIMSIEAAPEPASAEPVAWMHPNALENFKSGEFNRALVACEKVDDYTMPLYASQPAQEWQPIETAPKDGTEILLFSGWDIGLCYWRNDSCFLGWTWGAGNRFNNPSHWMPLPQPPGE